MRIVIRDFYTYRADLPGGVLTMAARKTSAAFYWPIRDRILPVFHFEYDESPQPKRRCFR